MLTKTQNQNRSSAWPAVVGLIVMYLVAAWVDPCDNAPDCRAATAQVQR